MSDDDFIDEFAILALALENQKLKINFLFSITLRGILKRETAGSLFRYTRVAVHCVLAYATARQERQQAATIIRDQEHRVNLGSAAKPPSTSDRRSSPLHTWPPHHSGAHRSDTPTLLHSFGRHPIPPRAYTLHQERSKQQGKRRERRPAEIVPRRANQSTAATEKVKSVVFCFFGSSSKKKQEFTH